MKKILHRIPFIRILAAFIAGILVSFYLTPLGNNIVIPIFIFTLATLILFHLKNLSNILTGLIFVSTIFMAGIARHNEFNKQPESDIGNYYFASINEFPIKKTNSYKTEAILKYASDNDTITKIREKIILYFEPDSSVLSINPGDMVVFKNDPSEIQNSGNPNEFDYKSYLSSKKIYRQAYLSSSNWLIAEKEKYFSLRIFAEKIRNKLLNIYKENNITGEEFGILSALTLGYKEALDPETRHIFSTAGVTHVLAVSGLHVGIIFLVINFVFGFLRRSKKGKLIFIITSISILWLFALITGLSPSVLRATVMFCFLIIGQNLRRPTNIYNTLALSAFILLVFNPNLIFEVGFQLSYSAVFGIIFFQPKINNWFHFKNKILKWAWALFSVSIAAQITTFPITFYYFNYFPSYFWISNFIAIPGAAVFIVSGLAILITSPIPAISSIIAWITSILLKFTTFLLNIIGDLPFATIRNIHLSGLQVFLLIFSILLFMLFIELKKRNYLLMILSSLIFILSLNIIAKLENLNKKEIIVYNSDEDLIHLISGFRNYVIFDNEEQLESYDMNYIDNTVISNHLDDPIFVKAGSSFNDGILFQEGPLISFDRKNLFIDNSDTKEFPDKIIDFLLTKRKKIETINTPAIVISTNKYTKETTEISRFYNVKKQGAFMFEFRIQ